MIYGYARVSSKEQTLERQLKILKEKGVDMANIFKEFASGKSFKNRIEYERLLEKCKVGDTIYFASLDRFSRNIVETTKQLETLENRGIKAVFIAEGISTEMQGVAKLIISIFSWVAEQERELIKERQRQGYNALAKDNKGRMISSKTGKPVGRKEISLDSRQLKLLEDYKSGKINITKVELAKLLGISRSVLYKKILVNEVS
ncbi:recombinase family protein [Fusobacterium polymorphum]|uniref:recombinase family protein n=1 Tax=Fusobacterium nucleatum subsp. polymorphum TaxID=76857 RepID=UPI003254FE56